MALPKDPISLNAPIDPAEELDYVMDFNAVLNVGEIIDTFVLTMSAEGAALGVSIMSGGGRDAAKVEDDRAILVWFKVSSEFQQNAAFAGEGISIGVECRIVTDALPARTRERTFALLVRQQ